VLDPELRALPKLRLAERDDFRCLRFEPGGPRSEDSGEKQCAVE
jgi:hypothetical protein